MELKFTQKSRNDLRIFTALFLAAVFGIILATIACESLIPVALVGAVIPLLPKKRAVWCILLGVVVLFLLIRFGTILDGFKLLANRMFQLSEQTQAYEYDYFSVDGDSAVEAVLLMAMVFGMFCSRWGNAVSLTLCGLWLAVMAYFGVTPEQHWFLALLLAGSLALLPRNQKWFYALIAFALLLTIGFGCWKLAPQPNHTVSQWDEDLRDALAGNSMHYEQEPVPTDVPQPEIVPSPSIEQEQPDHGVQKKLINILFITLSVVTLLLLFIPAVIKDRAAKRSEENRRPMRDKDPAKAIHAMYLYAGQWRKLSKEQTPVPGEIYGIWQEAVFSDHEMTEKQCQMMRQYMKETAEAVWNQADKRERLYIQYRLCL